jgi:hypothetical protein
MCALEFRCQFSRVQIFTDVGQPLFQLSAARRSTFFLIGDGNVAPHRIRTAGNAGHLAQGSSSDVEHRRVRPNSSTSAAARAVEIICGRWLIQAQTRS